MDLRHGRSQWEPGYNMSSIKGNGARHTPYLASRPQYPTSEIRRRMHFVDVGMRIASVKWRWAERLARRDDGRWTKAVTGGGQNTRIGQTTSPVVGLHRQCGGTPTYEASTGPRRLTY